MRHLIALLAVAALAPAPAGAYVPYTTADGIPLHWKVRTLGYQIGNDYPEDMGRAAIERVARDAFAAWTSLPCYDLEARFDGFRNGLARDSSDRVNAIVWIHDLLTWSGIGGSTELARTAITHRSLSGEIIDADIAFNLGGYPFSTDVACAEDVYDLEAALTHEVGHLLGLDHSLDPTATMHENTPPGVCDKRTLADDDIEGFCASYERLVPPVEPGPEPGPADAGPTDAAMAEPIEGGTPGSRDDGCAGGPAGASLVWLLGALASLPLRRRGRRATW